MTLLPTLMQYVHPIVHLERLSSSQLSYQVRLLNCLHHQQPMFLQVGFFLLSLRVTMQFVRYMTLGFCINAVAALCLLAKPSAYKTLIANLFDSPLFDLSKVAVWISSTYTKDKAPVILLLA